jgi:hypothetical protein
VESARLKRLSGVDFEGIGLMGRRWVSKLTGSGRWGLGCGLALAFLGVSAATMGCGEVLAAEGEEAVLEGAVLEEAAEIPEEILRTEIITEARSPLTGEPLSAAEYAQLQAELDQPAGGNLLNDDIRRLVFLLEFRRAFKPILPFLE